MQDEWAARRRRRTLADDRGYRLISIRVHSEPFRRAKFHIFSMAHMLSYISTYFTLEPGDLIWSGTMGSTQAMEPGDMYEIEISGVGTLGNKVVQGK